VLFKRDPFQRWSSWLVWLQSESFKGGAFTNFFRPTLAGDPAAKPDKFSVTYAPHAAVYTLEHEGLRCVTEIGIADDSPAVCMEVSLTNLTSKPLKLSAMPVLRPYVNPAILAPWDQPEWYLKTAFCREEAFGFVTRLFNMNSELEKRRAVVLWSSPENLSGAEISYEKFIGPGSFERPAAIFDGKLRLCPDDARPWGSFEEANTIYGYPPVYALQYDLDLAPGKTHSFRQVPKAPAPRSC